MAKHKGKPIMTLRMSKWQISGLKYCARKEGTTVSAIIRDLIDAYLAKNGIHAGNYEKLEGQLTADDFNV